MPDTGYQIPVLACPFGDTGFFLVQHPVSFEKSTINILPAV
jgi:hypothetical protein